MALGLGCIAAPLNFHFNMTLEASFGVAVYAAGDRIGQVIFTAVLADISGYVRRG